MAMQTAAAAIKAQPTRTDLDDKLHVFDDDEHYTRCFQKSLQGLHLCQPGGRVSFDCAALHQRVTPV